MGSANHLLNNRTRSKAAFSPRRLNDQASTLFLHAEILVGMQVINEIDKVIGVIIINLICYS